jgi:hypothetical protein
MGGNQRRTQARLPALQRGFEGVEAAFELPFLLGFLAGF